ncbi:phosphonate ABC transporter, permease protein PhnE [Shimia marina]|uniref:Phosphate-import permease protein PhnE n=1 Tax=Shimia marina TaxID=321267 RepID=A0A0P1ELK9_9RHOB|nr:Phosphate-import permease protein PhnE [Shimia marina]SFD61020.1 phosphonate transport system permease protein [Shimia marina]
MTDMTGMSRDAGGIRADYMAQVRRKRMMDGIILIVFVTLMVTGFMVADDRNAGGFWEGLHRLFDFPKEVLGEAFEKVGELPAHLWKFLPSLIETINIAAASTLIGTMLGMVLSLLSTRGMAKWPRLIPLFRRIMDIMRAMPEIVIALVLIFVMGGGPVPAMVAIAFHTAGAMGKLFSEVNENASLKPVEGLQSVGASWTQRMWLGVIPQVAPNYFSYALLRFEVNIRASAILGFVGAGGIGYELRNAMSWGKGQYDEAAAIFILLFATIVVVDQLSSLVRERLTHGKTERKLEKASA